MQTKHKAFDIIETKADDGTGTFEALVSVFGNVDHTGDRVLPGAFTNTLDSWRASGDPIPVILSHQWDDPFALIGKAEPKNVKQTPRGLMVKGTLDVKQNQVAAQVYNLMKSRVLKAFSFGYLVPEGGQSMVDGVNDISEIDLIEIGPTLKGVNPDAQLQSVKSLLHAQDMTPAQVQEKMESMAAALKADKPEMAARLLEMGGTVADLGSTTNGTPPVSVTISQTNATRRKADKARAEVATDDLSDPAPEPQEPEPDLGGVTTPDEVKGAGEGLLKAVWTTAYINTLPDGSFLYVAPGGSKDGEGKTQPRTLRYFPYKDASGTVDLPHLRNALARIPQSDLSQGVKDRLTSQAQKILDNQKALTPEEKVEQDTKAKEEALALAAGGVQDEPPPPPTTAQVGPLNIDEDELKAVNAGLVKAVWSNAYLVELPDSAFLYTDGDVRWFPYKNERGEIDVPHLQAAKAAIPEANLSQDVRVQLAQRAQRILDTAVKDQEDQEPHRATSSRHDPLREKAERLALEVMSGGLSTEPAPTKPPTDPAPQTVVPSTKELRERQRELILATLLSEEEVQ